MRLSGSVFNLVRRAFDGSHFLHLLVSEVVGDAEWAAAAESVVFDVVVGAVWLYVFDLYDVGSQNVIQI